MTDVVLMEAENIGFPLTEMLMLIFAMMILFTQLIMRLSSVGSRDMSFSLVSELISRSFWFIHHLLLNLLGSISYSLLLSLQGLSQKPLNLKLVSPFGSQCGTA